MNMKDLINEHKWVGGIMAAVFVLASGWNQISGDVLHNTQRMDNVENKVHDMHESVDQLERDVAVMMNIDKNTSKAVDRIETMLNKMVVK